MANLTARVKLVEGLLMLGESGSGHALVMDAAKEVGGSDLGIRPMELLLLGMGGCSSIDVVTILRKGRHTVTDCVAEISAERAPTDPKVFTDITVHFTVTGKALPEAAVERAIRLSEETYCSASAMLSKTAKMHFTFTIVETA
ncbi:MAG: OsmC family protein [Magnetococcales bacterium]|nr:OsmC family protein [Magnetococcales bacterium]